MRPEFTSRAKPTRPKKLHVLEKAVCRLILHVVLLVVGEDLACLASSTDDQWDHVGMLVCLLHVCVGAKTRGFCDSSCAVQDQPCRENNVETVY